MKNEDTVFDQKKVQNQETDQEATQLETSQPVSNKKSDVKSAQNWRGAAVGAGAGVLMGAAGTILTSGASVDPDTPITPDPDDPDTPENPVWVDEKVPVATTVTDEMSFSDAFSTARTEVGSGGVFEWRGNIYNTFTAEEWNAMSAEERAEFGSHFDWSETPVTHDADEPVVAQVETPHTVHPQTDPVVENPAPEDDIEVVSVDHPSSGQATYAVHEPEPVSDEPIVEVLGVEQHESGGYIGEVLMDGQQVLFVDVDGDMVFDAIATDSNGDGQISPDEVTDISELQVSVNDLYALDNTENNMYLANNDEPDYVNDADVFEG